MTAYTLNYEPDTGKILSIGKIYVETFVDYSYEGVFYIEAKPEDFSPYDYFVDIVRLDQDTNLPLYIICRTDGKAYGHDGVNDDTADLIATDLEARDPWAEPEEEEPGSGSGSETSIGDISSGTVSNGMSGLIGYSGATSETLSASQLGVVIASGVYSHAAFENDPISLSARGNNNHTDALYITTRLSFKNANLLAATVESISCETFTDQLYIVIPSIYTPTIGKVGPVLTFLIVNTGSTSAVVEDVKIRLLYTGVLEVLDEAPGITFGG